MTRRPLTDRQKEIYEFCRMYIVKNNKPPTRQEICDGFGFHRNAAQCHLLAMEKKGYVAIERNGDGSRAGRVHRGLRLL